MPSLLLDNNSAVIDTMKKESKEEFCPIWLLINSKSPSVRYDIWNPILDGIQDKVYRKLRKRIDKQHIYIKNVVSDIGIVPRTKNTWAKEAVDEIQMLRKSVLEHQPKIIITIGTLTYELVKRFVEVESENESNYWCTANLAVEFQRSIADFDINKINRIPLPRNVLKSHSKFIDDSSDSSWENGENYFRDVATKIADKIIENMDSLDIWID